MQRNLLGKSGNEGKEGRQQRDRPSDGRRRKKKRTELKITEEKLNLSRKRKLGGRRGEIRRVGQKLQWNSEEPNRTQNVR